MRSPRGVATDWIRHPRFADKDGDVILNAGVSRANQVRASPTFRHRRESVSYLAPSGDPVDYAATSY